MQMHDYISHFSIVDCSLGCAPPRLFRARIVGEHADNVQLIKIGEFKVCGFQRGTETRCNLYRSKDYPWFLSLAASDAPDRRPYSECGLADKPLNCVRHGVAVQTK